ncbi:MAG: hypothetical protein LBD53_04900 [Tannerella sp.]|jgi:hypothetical protein|nr:hypothetical protein [Tannerella sp.]
MKATIIFLAIISLTSCYSGERGGEYATSPGESGGQGGSMARFAVNGDYLYTVDNNSLKMFDITNAAEPKYLPAKNQPLNFGVETIFPLDTLLFIGTRNGMYVYDVRLPEFPQQLAHVTHITSCDPVVADGKYAYVTLNSANIFCGRNSNLLQIYDLQDIEKPQLIKELIGFNNPLGLGIVGDRLYICDNGIKEYDVSDPLQPQWIGDLSHISEIQNIDTYDVIPLSDKILLVIGGDGFYQFDISGDKLKYISSIKVKK